MGFFDNVLPIVIFETISLFLDIAESKKLFNLVYV